jgi:regulator of ribonuclease activity A
MFPMSVLTTDLCDTHADTVQIADPVFRDFGSRTAFHGSIATLKLFEDNSLVRAALEQPGSNRVLVIDGGGSLRCALVGDQLAALAQRNGWAGIVVFGCVRDTVALATIDIGIKALAAHPLRSVKRGQGERDVVVRFAGVTFRPGQYLYADADGLIVAEQALHS